jgi:hypothetical protein
LRYGHLLGSGSGSGSGSDVFKSQIWIWIRSKFVQIRNTGPPRGPQWRRTTSWPRARSSGLVLKLWSVQEAPILKAEMYWTTFVIIFCWKIIFFSLWPIRTRFILCSTLFSAYGRHFLWKTALKKFSPFQSLLKSICPKFCLNKQNFKGPLLSSAA